MKRGGSIFQGHGFKNIALLACHLSLEVDFNIFLPMIVIVKFVLSNKLKFWPLKKPTC